MCPEQSALTPLSGGPQTGRRSRHTYSPLTRSALTIQISRKATKSAQTITATISHVFRPLGDQKVAGGVLTVAPILFAEKWTAGPRRDLIMPVGRMRGLFEISG